jgi:hypothetical protein
MNITRHTELVLAIKDENGSLKPTPLTARELALGLFGVGEIKDEIRNIVKEVLDEKDPAKDANALIDLCTKPQNQTYAAPAPRTVAETASRIRPTPPEFKFDDVHADARTKACIIAKILREYGPLGRKGLFARAKEYAIFAAVTRAQAAYAYASILVEGGVAVNVSAGRRGLWAIARNAGIDSDADIAAAVQLIQKPLFEKLGGRGRAALSAIAATLAI